MDVFIRQCNVLQDGDKALFTIQTLDQPGHGIQPSQGMQRATVVTGGRSDERATASAEAVNMVCVGTPDRSFSSVRSRISDGGVSSMN